MTIETTRADRLPALDTMRAVGSLAVVVTHVGFVAGVYGQSVGGRLAARMDVGVALFFVLSGFLLSRQWFLRAAAGSAPPRTRTYLRKRFARIFPAYAVVAVVVLLIIPENREDGWSRVVSTLTMTDVYVSDDLPTGYTQTWSLATEVAFYVALPLVMRVAVGPRLSTRRVLSVLGSLSVLNICWLTWLSPLVPSSNDRVNEWLPAYLTWFCVGMLLALVHTRPEQLSRLAGAFRSLASFPGSCLVVALGLLLVAGSPLAGPSTLEPATPGQGLTKNLVYAVVGGVVILPAVFGPQESRYVRLLSAPMGRWLGTISYSLFLVHMLVLEALLRVVGITLFASDFMLVLALTLVPSVVLAALLYRFVEAPALVALSGRSAMRQTTDTATTHAWPVQASSPAQPESPPHGRNA